VWVKSNFGLKDLQIGETVFDGDRGYLDDWVTLGTQSGSLDVAENKFA
jgi:hypothetical protein